MYTKRKDFLEGMLQAEADKLNNQARFIMEKCDSTLIVENKKRKTIVDELIRRGYEPDPVKTWKFKNMPTDDEEQAEDEEEEGGSTSKKPVDPEKEFKNASDVKKFDYLLGMSMWMLTEEKKNELLKQRDKKLAELDALRKKTNKDLWRDDLDVFIEKLDAVEEKERKDEAGERKKIENVQKKKVAGGRKRVMNFETLPSPAAQRVIPKVGDDMKKKVAARVKGVDKEKKLFKKEVNVSFKF